MAVLIYTKIRWYCENREYHLCMDALRYILPTCQEWRASVT